MDKWKLQNILSYISPIFPISNMVYRQFYSIKFLCDEHRGQSAAILLVRIGIWYQQLTMVHELWPPKFCKNIYFLPCNIGKIMAFWLFSYTLWLAPGSRSKLSGSRIADVSSGHNDQLYFVRLLG